MANSEDLRWQLVGNAAGDLSLGGARSGTTTHSVSRTIAIARAAGDHRVEDSGSGFTADQYTGDYCVVYHSINNLPSFSRVARQSGDLFELADPMPYATTIGDAYRIHENPLKPTALARVLYRTPASALQCALGSTRYRAVVCVNPTAQVLTNAKVYFWLARSSFGPYHLAISAGDDLSPADEPMATIANEATAPSLTQHGVAAAFSTPIGVPGVGPPSYPGDQGRPIGSIGASFAGRSVWLRAACDPLTRPHGRETVVLLVCEATSPSPAKQIYGILPIALAGVGFTPVLTFAADRGRPPIDAEVGVVDGTLPISAGARFEIEIRAAETGELVPGMFAKFALSGSGALSDPDGETDARGRAGVVYKAPTNEGLAGTTFDVTASV